MAGFDYAAIQGWYGADPHTMDLKTHPHSLLPGVAFGAHECRGRILFYGGAFYRIGGR